MDIELYYVYKQNKHQQTTTMTMRLLAISLMLSVSEAFRPLSIQQQRQQHGHPLYMASTPLSRKPANSLTPWKEGDKQEQPITTTAGNNNNNMDNTLSSATHQNINDLNNAVAHSQFKASRNRSAASTMPPEVVRPQQPLPLVDYMMPAAAAAGTTTDSGSNNMNEEEHAWWHENDENEDVPSNSSSMGEITVGGAKTPYLDSLVPPEHEDLPTFIPSPLSKHASH